MTVLLWILFTAIFNGNGHTISRLHIDRSADDVGLFGRVGLVSVTVGGGNHVGGLVGHSAGRIVSSYVTGAVVGTGDAVGALVGRNEGAVASSYATGAVDGDGVVGGLVGLSAGTLEAITMLVLQLRWVALLFLLT